jgi:hypothetical protein
VWIHPDNDLIDLTIVTTAKGAHGTSSKSKSEVVHTNQKHPFLTTEHGFLPVGQIKVGMHVVRADGRIGVITRWTIVPGVKMMYNLEVAQDHTFTVGDGQWVVHNCGPVNSKGNPYPQIMDPRTGSTVPFPSGTLQRIDRSLKVTWDSVTDRYAYIKEWYDRGFKDPPRPWGDYDIHHILPKEFGGTNDFWNLVPVERDFHIKIVTPWWNAFFP